MYSIWNFVKNYRKPILVTAGIVGGVIGLRSYISSFEQQWQQSASRSFVSEVHKKGTYFDKSVEIGNQMANGQYSAVINAVRELFDIDDLLQTIKDAKQNGLGSKEIVVCFEKIKLDIFSYAISEVYAIAFFITYMRVQLSITSGTMYLDSNANNANSSAATSENGNDTSKQKSSKQKSSSNSSSVMTNGSENQDNVDLCSYQMFLQLLENFQLLGVEHLVSNIRKIVDQSFAESNVKVTDRVTLNKVLAVLEKVKSAVSNCMPRLIEENAAIVFSTNKEHFMAPDAGARDGAQFDELNSQNPNFVEIRRCSKLIDEMLDIVKISDFAKVIGDCTNIGFSNMYDFVSECFMKLESVRAGGGEGCTSSDAIDHSFGVGAQQFINPNKIMLPLVKLLPELWRQLNHTTGGAGGNQTSAIKFVRHESQFNDSKKNRNSLLVQYLLCSDSLTCFSANLYEAFCNENAKQ